MKLEIKPGDILLPPHDSIWTDSSLKNQWVCFRKGFFLVHVPKKAEARIGIETKYWLWVNGQQVVFDGGLLRESLPSCGYYDSVNLSPHLREGHNEIFVLAWYWGNQGRNNVDSGEPGFLFLCPELSLSTDLSWEASVHPCFYETGPPFPSYLYGGHNIGYDALKENCFSWETPRKTDCTGWNRLLPRQIPLFFLTEPREYRDVQNQNGETVCLLPYAMHVSPSFQVECSGGMKIHMRTDRYEVRGGPGDHHHFYRSHRAEYITRPGRQTFILPTWLFGETVFYTFPEETRVISVSYLESGYDTQVRGAFTCSDPMVNRLAGKCLTTLRACMRENLMDCPDRERGQWIGDVSTQVPQVFYSLSSEAHFLCRKAILDFIQLRRENVLVGNVPGSRPSELPSQSLNAISDIGMILEYYRHSGERELVDLAYPAVHRYLMLWDMGPDGLVVPRNGDWRWFDHLDDVDGTVLENAWYALALAGAWRMATISGNVSFTGEYQKRTAAIRKGFAALRQNHGYASGEFYDDRANAMALLSGLCDPEMIPSCIRILRDIRRCTPYMEYYVLLAMFRAGYPREAFQRMMERYKPLVENGDSTLWEDFSILGTRNHAWSGGPLTLLYRYLLGVFPLRPGYSLTGILPEYVGIDRITGTVPSVRGEIQVEINWLIRAMEMNVRLPEGIRAICGFPKSRFPDPPSVTINGNRARTREHLHHHLISLPSSGTVQAVK